MSELRPTIEKEIDLYKQNIDSPLSSSMETSDTPSMASSAPSTVLSTISKMLWYLFTTIIVCMLIVWIIYSLGGHDVKTRIHSYLEYIKNIFPEFALWVRHLFVGKQSSSSTSSSSSTTDISDDPVDTSMEINERKQLNYSNIEQSTQAINTALNSTPPDMNPGSTAFQNDDPDSAIQASSHSHSNSDLWWYIDGDNGVPQGGMPLPNVYLPQ
jgi:hypothetical protein